MKKLRNCFMCEAFKNANANYWHTASNSDQPHSNLFSGSFFSGCTNLWLFLGFSMVPDLFQKSGLKEDKPEAYSNLGHFRRSEPKSHYTSIQSICTCITDATFHWLASHMASTHDCLKIPYTL